MTKLKKNKIFPRYQSDSVLKYLEHRSNDKIEDEKNIS